MLADRAPRSAATRAASAAVLVLALTGCSLFDSDSGPERVEPENSVSAGPASASPSASPSATASVTTARETCDRAGQLAQDARQRLREEPLALLAEIDDIAATAPSELAEQIAAVREAVEGYRQGDQSFLGVVQEARDLQKLCTT